MSFVLKPFLPKNYDDDDNYNNAMRMVIAIRTAMTKHWNIYIVSVKISILILSTHLRLGLRSGLFPLWLSHQ
jgi:hypothetical protein